MPRFSVFHDSRELASREPFGALRCGQSVTLRLFITGEDLDKTHALLRVWDGEERFLEGEASFDGGAKVFSFRVTAPARPAIMWYSFRIHSPEGFFYAGAEDPVLRSGRSVLTQELPHDWRITVYDADFRTPDRFKGAIVYQIFPDRFRRGEYPGLEAGLDYHRGMGRRITVKDWDEEVDYLPRGEEPYYSPSDFYLGNFAGIIEKIPYLASLGVTVLYLNPIFESPYNHRYSISDYERIDPLLGGEEDLARLISELKAAGMSLVLDGVFSHTGDDSRYFDRRSVYGGGAYHDPASPYREWYDFSRRWKHGYRCWWDFETLPEVEELTPSFMEFTAKVMTERVKQGAGGWRLDVADELPDEYIKFLRRRLKDADPDALLIGEVWEDAVMKKDGWGNRREYVNGLELDGVMDYPFRDAALDFLLGKTDSYALKAALGAQLEGYPSDFMRAQFGYLGSHDTERILSALQGAPLRSGMPRTMQARWKPTEQNARLGKKRLLQASALQFSMPFSPVLYYGDEAGLTGLEDPFCRRPYPWGHEDKELLAHYRAVSGARTNCPALREGLTSFASPSRDVFAIGRRACGSEAVTMINRGGETTVSLSPASFKEGEGAPSLRGVFRDALTGEEFAFAGEGSVHMPENAARMLILS
ncbi:MAG: glycoside hydrolase family 13 protein [Clostridiales bacterium]|nr:glycoside hydrolase family 13 protein [Clostridiales bacterium]